MFETKKSVSTNYRILLLYRLVGVIDKIVNVSVNYSYVDMKLDNMKNSKI